MIQLEIDQLTDGSRTGLPKVHNGQGRAFSTAPGVPMNWQHRMTEVVYNQLSRLDSTPNDGDNIHGRISKAITSEALDIEGSWHYGATVTASATNVSGTYCNYIGGSWRRCDYNICNRLY